MGNAVMSLFELQAVDRVPALVYRRELGVLEKPKWSRQLVVNESEGDNSVDKGPVDVNSAPVDKISSDKFDGVNLEPGYDCPSIGQNKNKHQICGRWPVERGMSGRGVHAPHESAARATTEPAESDTRLAMPAKRSGVAAATAATAASAPGHGHGHTTSSENRCTGTASQPLDQNNIAPAGAVDGQSIIMSPDSYLVDRHHKANKTNNGQRNRQGRTVSSLDPDIDHKRTTTDKSVVQSPPDDRQNLKRLGHRHSRGQSISTNDNHKLDDCKLLIIEVSHKISSDCNNNDNNIKQAKQKKKSQKKTRRKQKQQALDPQAPATEQLIAGPLDLSSKKEPSKRSPERAFRKLTISKPPVNQLTCEGSSKQKQQQVGPNMRSNYRRDRTFYNHHQNNYPTHNHNHHNYIQHTNQHNHQNSRLQSPNGGQHYNQLIQHDASYPPPPPPRPWLSKVPPRDLRHSCAPRQRSLYPEFTVISYNVLCDRMVNNKMFPSSPDIALDWSYRRKLILRELLTYDADVIALQELELEQFEAYFKPELDRFGKYEALFEPKSRAKTMEPEKRKRVDGCAIFYKRDKFNLVQRHLMEFSQIAMANAQGSEAMLNRVMTKDNIGLVAVLEFKSHGDIRPRRILVCNTHIHWDPECCDVKLIQTIMMMNELKHLARHYAKDVSPEPMDQWIFRNFRCNSVGPRRPPTQSQQFKPRRLPSLMYSPFQGYEDDDSVLTATSSSSPSSSSASSIVDGDCKDRDDENNNQLGGPEDMIPLVLLGDFNSTPNSGVTSFLTSGKITSLHQDFKDYRYTDCQNALALLGLRCQQESTGGDVGAMDRRADGSLIDRRLSSPAWYYNPYSVASLNPYHQTKQHGVCRQQSLAMPSKSSGSTITSASSCASSYSSFSSSPRCHSPQVLAYQHPFKLVSAYQRDTMPYTNYTTNFKAVIDYIFYSSDSIQVLGVLGPLNKNWLKDNQIHGLPQPHLPSDHLPLLVRLRFNNPPNCSNKKAINI